MSWIPKAASESRSGARVAKAAWKRGAKGKWFRKWQALRSGDGSGRISKTGRESRTGGSGEKCSLSGWKSRQERGKKRREAGSGFTQGLSRLATKRLTRIGTIRKRSSEDVHAQADPYARLPSPTSTITYSDHPRNPSIYTS